MGLYGKGYPVIIRCVSWYAHCSHKDGDRRVRLIFVDHYLGDFVCLCDVSLALQVGVAHFSKR